MLSLFTRELRNIYPTNGTLVSIDVIISDIESKYDSVHECIKDIFTYAKQVIIDNQKGVNSHKYQPGLLAEMEFLIDRYITWYLNKMITD